MINLLTTLVASGAGGTGVFYLLKLCLNLLNDERKRQHQRHEHERDRELWLKVVETKSADEAEKVARAMRLVWEIELPAIPEKPEKQEGKSEEQPPIEGLKPPLAIEAPKSEDAPSGESPHNPA